ncbi:MAG: hypothetical protein ACTSVE_07550 [Candidatus Helarchaeota archaeon]
MPFDEKFDDIYKFGIKGAAEEAGAYAERLDEQIFTEGMLDRIFNQISKADVIVADMTGRNPNVFYEVGYAHSLGKIVLLLTQDSNDIPFDLKHRQHTVYGGSIDTLKTELITKLQWALKESRNKRDSRNPERFSMSLLNINIPYLGSSGEIPIISGDVNSLDFLIPLKVRNDSVDNASAISHVYLFCEENTIIVPSQYKTDYSSFDNNFQWTAGPFPLTSPQKVELHPLESFKANPIDAADGLKKQFRLPITFPALPPGAVEIAELNLMFLEKKNNDEYSYRIRLHSATQYHDFPFRLNIKYKEKTSKKSKSQERTSKNKGKKKHKNQ